MPKDKQSLASQTGESKKVVVVEEVEEVESPKEETSNTPKVKDVVAEEKSNNSNESVDLVEDEKPNYLWIIIPTALLVGALVGGLITYFSGIAKLSSDNNTVAPVETSTPESVTSPTPKPKSTIKREEVKIQVLNGSGTSGLAGKAKTYLESLGYKDVAVGNAASSDFAETEIQIKDSIKDFLDTITTDLSKNYQVASETTVLSASSKYDLIITLGKK